MEPRYNEPRCNEDSVIYSSSQASDKQHHALVSGYYYTYVCYVTIYIRPWHLITVILLWQTIRNVVEWWWGIIESQGFVFFCYQCAVMKIFLQNVVHEYLLSLIKKKKSFLAMQEYFSGLLSTHEIFHSIFLCLNNFFVLKKLLTSCPVRYKIHSLSLWASYCCLSNDPGWGGNKNDSVSISCSGTMTFNTHFFATERHCSRAWYGDWIILRFSVNHNIYICGIFLPCHFQRQEPMKGIL